jgi:hypothetical protein
MKAGFAEIVITPSDGEYYLAAYGDPKATGVHDDVYASAVYLGDDHTKALLISLDLIGMRRRLVLQLKAAVQQAVDIEADHIFFTCTHTHKGPDVLGRVTDRKARGVVPPGYMAEYPGFLAAQVEIVAREAAANARACDLYANRAYVDENMNRRFFFASGEYRNVPGHKDLIPITYGHTDKELGMIYFCPKGQRQPYGMIVNYTVHPLTAGGFGTLLTADIPGVVRDLVKETMGCLTCYVTGAAGDNHPKRPEGGFAETRRVGSVLATEAINRSFDAARIEGDLGIKSMTRSVTLKRRTLEEMDEIAGRTGSPRAAAPFKKLLKQPGAPIEAEFTLLAIGPILFIGVPGELVSELGSMLKWYSPFQRTYVMYLATDFWGYIGHPNAYQWGGYEPIAGMLSPSSVRPLMNAIIDAAEELAK